MRYCGAGAVKALRMPYDPAMIVPLTARNQKAPCATVRAQAGRNVSFTFVYPERDTAYSGVAPR